MTPYEQRIHTALTRELIEGRPADIVIERAQVIETPEGGSYTGEDIPLPPQRMRVVESASRGGELTTTTQITEFEWESVLLALPGADMKVEDKFSHEGRRYKIAEIAENREWRTLGRLERLGT